MECPICLDQIETTRNCVTTDCGHKFHASCLMKHSHMNGFSCPLCRTQMVENDAENENDEEDPVYDDEMLHLEELHRIEDDEILRREQERYDILRGRYNERRSDELQRQDEQFDILESLYEDGEPNDDSNDQQNGEAPPIEYISEQLVARGITMDNLVAASLRTNSNYYKNMGKHDQINNAITKHICEIVFEYMMTPNASYE